jgi:hypothetical protein
MKTADERREAALAALDRYEEDSAAWHGDLSNEEIVDCVLFAAFPELDWQPITTAPADGSPILVGAEGVTPDLAWWAASVWFTGWCCGGQRADMYGPDFTPTHWMPLPSPPSPALAPTADAPETPL